jgi:hypothetical protein
VQRVKGFIQSLSVAEIIPALAFALYGATWIIFHASARGITHSLFQALALAEGVTATLLVRRKPLGSLLSILIIYLIVDLEPLTLPPALFAVGTLAAIGRGRAVLIGTVTSLTVVLLMPHLHGNPVTISDAVWHVAAVVGAVLAGLLLRARKQFAANPAQQEQSGDV